MKISNQKQKLNPEIILVLSLEIEMHLSQSSWSFKLFIKKKKKSISNGILRFNTLEILP